MTPCFFCLCKCYHSFGSLVFNLDPLKSKFLLFLLLSTDKKKMSFFCFFVVDDDFDFCKLKKIVNFLFVVSSRSHNHITQLAPVLLRIINRETARRMVGQVHPPGAVEELEIWPDSWRLPLHPTHLRLHRHRQ
jgi:hypothetical protein